MKDFQGQPDHNLPARRPQPSPLGPPPMDYVDDYAPEPPQPMAAKKLSIKMVFRALRRHWWQALLLWIVGTAGLIAFAYTKIQPTFDAMAQVKVETENNVIFGQGTNAVDFGQFMKTQASFISNPNVVGAALAEHPDIANTPMLAHSVDREYDIAQALQVVIVPQTQFIQIRMSSTLPGEAAKIVNAVVEAYLKHAAAIYDSSNAKRVALLKITRDEQYAVVQDKRKLVQSLTDQIGHKAIEVVQSRDNMALDAYRLLSEQLTNTEIRVITAKAKLDQLRSLKEIPRQQNSSADQLPIQVTEKFLSHPEVMAIQAQIDKAARKVKEVERLARNPADPAHIRAVERLNELNQDREDLWRQLEPMLRQQMASTPVDVSVENSIKEAELSLTALIAEKDALQSRLEQVKIANTTALGEQNRLEYAKKDLLRVEQVFDRIEDTMNQLKFDARNPTARVELVNEATSTVRPNGDRRKQVMAGAPLIVGMLVAALMMLLEFVGGRVSDPEELTSRMHLQVIGVVPPLPQIRVGMSPRNGSGPPATSSEVRAQRELDEFVQSLDHLRVALCARRDQWGRDRHCVLITSACGSEGKTTLAAQLAERCVNAGLMTLLIDADLRNPTLSRMLDAADSPGLINVLRGEMLAEDVVQVVGDAGGFHLLPAGTPRVDPSRLLQGERLGKLIAQARESFEMIIVDAPPVLPVPDALTIGRWTDGAVLAVRYDTSRFPLVERANKRLAHVGVPVIGAVVNGVRSMESAYGGYYGYSYSSTNFTNAPTTTVEE